MKEYKTWEAIKMLSENPELKFESEDNELNIKQTLFVNELGYLEMNNEGCSNEIVGNLEVNDLWTLVQRPVKVMDAIKSYHEGQSIYCILKSGTYVYKPCIEHKLANYLEGYTLDDDWDNAMSTDELLNGIWYIGEPNE